MTNEEMLARFEALYKECEQSDNEQLKKYAADLKKIVDMLNEKPKGRVIEAACEMQTVSA